MESIIMKATLFTDLLYKSISYLKYVLVSMIFLNLSATSLADNPIPKLYTDLDTENLQQLLVNRNDIVLIDVRMGEEVALEGTIDAGYRNYNVSRGWLEILVGNLALDKDTPIVMICNTATRSPFAAKTMIAMGYSNVYNYTDGFYKWRDAGLPIRVADEYIGSMLYRKPIEVSDGIWTAIGATAPPTLENSGHNNNLSFIITKAGVVVVNAGGSYLLAQALHAEIKQLTDLPVKFVTLENGQGHAMLGSDYWQQQGATVIAHDDTATEIEDHGYEVLARMQGIQRDKAMGTVLSQPNITFTDKYTIELGGEKIEILNLGPSHSHGDVVVWLPQRKLMIAGDIAFHQRLLPVFDDTDTAAWIETWEAFAAIDADIIIPGHGDPTVLSELEKYTVDYLKYIRSEASKIIEAGGTLEDAYKIDQSAYAHLHTFDELANRNAGRIFRAMEFE
ncbi:MAG: rhodanese-related sulfurtransferase [Cellvibrionaceae bacterium]|jgi:rhodanese-related sulfurtransferase/glyoxylase-like metal-dependent hydrolase (beta-lactamase superfamily II)